MSWAKKHIFGLKLGHTVQFRPVGRSMQGLISSGQLVTVKPWKRQTNAMLEIGDIVLCTVNKKDYLHKILDRRVYCNKLQYLIGNNKGGVNGWTGVSFIYGKVIKVED